MPAAYLDIPVQAPFRFEECLWFLDRNFDDCMYRIRDGIVRKAVLLAGEPVVIEVTGSGGALCARAAGRRPGADALLRDYVAGWFDAARDLRPFYRLLEQHPALRYMPGAFGGLRLLSLPDLFETLCWAIIGQQINLSFAYRLKRRLVERYGTVLRQDDEPYYLFPTPAALAAADPGELRAAQFSARKAEYLTGLAQDFARGAVSREQLDALPGVQERLAALTTIRGIGAWTANYTLMKCLREPSCVPYGDAGLHNALIAHGIIRDKQDPESIVQLFTQFSGWESYLVLYLWRSLSSPPAA